AKTQSLTTQIIMGYGDYQEPSTVTLVDGVGIFGGYDPANKWTRTTTQSTTIRGASPVLSGRGLKLAMTFGRITVKAPDGAQPGESSVALLCVDVAKLTLDDTCTLQAGKGSAGAPGGDGAQGTGGQAGQKGGDGNVDNQSSPGLGGLPGENTD